MISTTISATGQPAILLELKDLRIGNILLYKGEYVHVTSLSMDIDDEYQETIGFCKIGTSTNEISDWNRALVADLSPIPLTPEILEKADVSNFPFELFYVGGRYHIALENGNWVFIEYLHQLQNLYFPLTGEELTINL